MKLTDAKAALNAKDVSKKLSAASKKLSAVKSPGFGWEVGAYAIRSVSVVAPASIIMTLENSWVKSGIGLLAAFMIIALLVIFKEPIEKASNYAPGTFVFIIFVIIAVLFKTVSNVLLTVGISGMCGCGIAAPLHIKYLSYKKQEKSPELLAMETLCDRLK
jgi:hypothetical protein